MTGQQRSTLRPGQRPPSNTRQQSNAAQGVRQAVEPGGGPDGQQGSDRGTRAARAGPRADEGIRPAEGGAEEVVLQEDEVEWGDEGGAGGDPALQHALAVIRARGERTQAMRGPNRRGWGEAWGVTALVCISESTLETSLMLSGKALWRSSSTIAEHGHLFLVCPRCQLVPRGESCICAGCT